MVSYSGYCLPMGGLQSVMIHTEDGEHCSVKTCYHLDIGNCGDWSEFLLDEYIGRLPTHGRKIGMCYERRNAEKNCRGEYW
jgi:hypothetical protein